MKLKSNVLSIAIIAATGGLSFGFDTGVISGALLSLPEYWQLSDANMEWITITVLIGAVIGALGSGKLSGVNNRKKMIIINVVIFAIGAIGCAHAPSVLVLIIMRIIIGIAIGITSYVVSIYISRISPARVRGGGYRCIIIGIDE